MSRALHEERHNRLKLGMSKSSVTFVEGIHTTFGEIATHRGLEQWHLVGRVEDQPFCLFYIGMGATNWQSPVTLTPTLRRRILAQFKKEVRGQKHTWLQEFEIDLFHKGPAHDALTAACLEFHKTAWRDKMLDDRDEDYIVLNVPYADREKAGAAGCKWWAHHKVWVIHKTLDQAPVAQWLV